MEKVTYKEIANYVDKSEATIKGWKVKHPQLLELTKLGAFCKKNNITMEHIKKCMELKEIVKNEK